MGSDGDEKGKTKRVRFVLAGASVQRLAWHAERKHAFCTFYELRRKVEGVCISVFQTVQSLRIILKRAPVHPGFAVQHQQETGGRHVFWAAAYAWKLCCKTQNAKKVKKKILPEKKKKKKKRLE